MFDRTRTGLKVSDNGVVRCQFCREPCHYTEMRAHLKQHGRWQLFLRFAWDEASTVRRIALLCRVAALIICLAALLVWLRGNAGSWFSW